MKKQLCNFILRFFKRHPTGTVDQIRNFIIARNRRISPTHQEVNNHMKIIGIMTGHTYQDRGSFNKNFVGQWELKPNAEELIQKYT